MQSRNTPKNRLLSLTWHEQARKALNSYSCQQTSVKVTIFRFSKNFKAISYSDLQHIQMSIASMVILYNTKHLYHREIQANASTVQKKLSASVQMHDMKHNVEKSKQKSKIKGKTKQSIPNQSGYTTPNSPRKRVKAFSSRGLVRISASWLSVSTCIRSTTPFSY